MPPSTPPSSPPPLSRGRPRTGYRSAPTHSSALFARLELVATGEHASQGDEAPRIANNDVAVRVPTGPGTATTNGQYGVDSKIFLPNLALLPEYNNGAVDMSPRTPQRGVKRRRLSESNIQTQRVLDPARFLPADILAKEHAHAPDAKIDVDPDDEDDDFEEEFLTPVDEEPIIPNYEGFKAHVRRLNPDMDPEHDWLVYRIAHQQEVRFKNLLDMKVKHCQAVSTQGACTSGRHSLATGGPGTFLHLKSDAGEEGNRTARHGSLQVVPEFSDRDSNPGEGALNDETFPIGVPMPPTRNLPAEFECQLCFTVKKFQKPSDWTKHVHEDVQPFTCTYSKCKEPKSFKRKADWVRHENERHRHLEWWICQYEDCRHPCYRKDNFLQHLVREHKFPEV